MTSRGGQWPNVSINLNDHNSGLNKPGVHLGTITHLTPTANRKHLVVSCLQSLARTW